jgi:ATP-dependent RNA helicase DHX29
MAGKKKAKKPAANPARGFATTSIPASKVRVELEENAEEPTGAGDTKTPTATDATATNGQNGAGAPGADKTPEKALSPEEFEKQLEESELQLLVEKYAPKVKRDAQRLRTRLETDRRVLRGQSETINSKKWLPAELMDQIIDLIQAESRFAASTFNSENGSSNKTFQEEDLTIKLWTLQQTLVAAGFPETKIKPVLQFVLDIAPNVSVSNRESVWGLDESLEWLARECEREELPDYEGRGKTGLKSQAGKDTPNSAHAYL